MTEADAAPAEPLTLEAAADAVVCLESPCVLLDPRDVVLDDVLLRSNFSGGYFTALRTTPHVRTYRIRDAVLDADTMLLSKHGRTIAQTAAFGSPEHQRPAGARPPRQVRIPDTATAVIGCNLAYRYVFYWLTQCLPAIDWSLRQQRDRPCRLLLPPLAPWQEETLALLGHAKVPRVVLKPGTQYLLPDAEYSDFLHGWTTFQLSRCLAATGRRAAEACQGASPHAIVYVPCPKPFYGPIVNEDEVIAFLRARGAFILPPAGMSFAERIVLFRDARVIIGAHGAALTGILFSRPGAVLWELMPEHFQYACYNRLAQSCGLHYWGNVFPSTPEGGVHEWRIDLAALAAQWPAVPAAAARAPPPPLPEPTPLVELMTAFESLGDNCEFGTAQRHVNSEPLGLLRFLGFFQPVEIRLEHLVAALDSGFAGLGEPGTVNVTAEGAEREYMMNETAWGLRGHTFRYEPDITAEALQAAEALRLGFLRRKLLEDLAAGEKIWVWKSHATTRDEQIRPLLQALRRRGPNILLWVTIADPQHPSGSLERLEPDLLKGYIARFGFGEDGEEMLTEPWLEICQRAYNALGRG